MTYSLAVSRAPLHFSSDNLSFRTAAGSPYRSAWRRRTRTNNAIVRYQNDTKIESISVSDRNEQTLHESKRIVGAGRIRRQKFESGVCWPSSRSPLYPAKFDDSEASTVRSAVHVPAGNRWVGHCAMNSQKTNWGSSQFEEDTELIPKEQWEVQGWKWDEGRRRFAMEVDHHLPR